MQMVRKNLPKERGENMEINMKAFIALLENKFNNNQSEMARNIGISKYQLNMILKNNGRNAGKKVIGGIIKFCIANNYNFMDYIFLTWNVKKN